MEDRKGRRFENRHHLGAADILAQAYIFRQNSTAYAICDKDTIVGLVFVRDRPEADNRYYSFTELFVADDFLGKGYGNQADCLDLDDDCVK